MNGRVALAIVLLVGGVGIAVAGASPQATLTPSAAHEADPGEVRVKGMVETVDRANRTFVITDGDQRLSVEMSRSLPEAVSEERSVVAAGRLVDAGDGRVLDAEEVLIGCPSKYEA